MIRYLLVDNDNTLMDFYAAEEKALRDTLLFYALPATEEVTRLYSAINDRHWKALERGETTSDRLKIDRFADFLHTLGHNEFSAP